MENQTTDRSLRQFKHDSLSCGGDVLFQKLPLELWQLIGDYFSLRDLWHFIQLKKSAIHLLCLEQWKMRFEQRWLKKAEQALIEDLQWRELDGLLTFLKENAGNAILAGSYPLLFISGADYQPADIDLFIRFNEQRDCRTIENRIQLEDQFRSLGFTQVDLSAELGRDASMEILSKYRALGSLKSLTHYRKGKIQDKNLQVQVSVMEMDKNSSMEDYVMQHFDMDFCKCWYDGKAMGCKDVFSVIRKQGRVNTQGNTLSKKQTFLQQRIEKYKNRGFTVI